MTGREILLGVLIGLLINECCEVSPWVARRLVRWAARRRYANPTRAEVRAEEHVTLIDDLPGKLFKLVTAVSFVAVALAASGLRAARGALNRQPRDGWPGGLPRGLLRLAARRLPESHRERFEEGCAPELHWLQYQTGGRLMTRWAVSTYFAATLVIRAKRIGRNHP
jgi:hypothetical protein